VTELQRHFRAIFDKVVRKKTPVVLTRSSRPEAALISYQDYLHFQEILEGDANLLEPREFEAIPILSVAEILAPL
jgi:prevent-host-death family protein